MKILAQGISPGASVFSSSFEVLDTQDSCLLFLHFLIWICYCDPQRPLVGTGDKWWLGQAQCTVYCGLQLWVYLWSSVLSQMLLRQSLLRFSVSSQMNNYSLNGSIHVVIGLQLMKRYFPFLLLVNIWCVEQEYSSIKKCRISSLCCVWIMLWQAKLDEEILRDAILRLLILLEVMSSNNVTHTTWWSHFNFNIKLCNFYPRVLKEGFFLYYFYHDSLIYTYIYLYIWLLFWSSCLSTHYHYL